MKTSSYILTYRSGNDPARRANLDAVLNWLINFPQFEVIIVEQDRTPTLQGALPLPDARIVFAHNPGPFNKSWGFNVGARIASTPILGFADADVICASVGEAANAVAREIGAVNPYRRLIDLTEAESTEVRSGRFDLVPDRGVGGSMNRTGIQEHIVFCGGIVFFQRNAFAHTGGWDERFVGWGAEDDAMTRKVQRARINAMELDSHVAIHLHHARDNARLRESSHYANNLRLLDQYRDLSDDALKRLCEVQLQLSGYREKYRPTVER